MSDNPENLERFNHIPFPVELELGRIDLDLQSILRLREGDELRTTQSAGVPVRVFAGGVEFAVADLVTVENKVAARIAKISLRTVRGGDDGNP